jgi:hypothetical protein
MTSADTLSPIRNFGYFLIIVGLLGFALHLLTIGNPDYPAVAGWFVRVISAYHLVVGIGLIRKRKWGLYSLKAYLYLWYIAFPIGTFIAHKTIKYIEKHKIEIHFT